MIVPMLILAVGLLAVLAYFTRQGVTYTNASPKGGIGMAIIVFIIFAIVGYFLDVYLQFSLIFTYMFSVGGALQAIAVVFWVAFGLLMLSMLWAAKKSGQMVA